MNSSIFFWSWPTWAKLSFVLSGCLVIVLALASVIKLAKIIKIRKLTDKQGKDVERAESRVRFRSSEEIPFGAKAMLEDPDVEGVWNSRASTPLQSPILGPRSSSSSRQSLNPFSRSRRNSSVSSLVHYQLPDSGQSYATASDNMLLPANETVGVSASTASQPNRNSQVAQWQTKNPTLHAQGDTMPRRRSVTIRAISKQDISGEVNSASIDMTKTRRTRVSTDPTPSTSTPERRGRSLVLIGPAMESAALERTPTTRKVLDRMEAHRRFHAAESGQLKPRIRIDIVEGTNPGHKYSASDKIVLEQENNRAVSWPITPGELLVDFNAPQKVQTMTSPHVTPFRAFVEMHPPPKDLLKTPPSAWTDRTQGKLSEKLEVQVPKKRITIKNNNADTTSKELQNLTTTEDVKEQNENVSLLSTQLRRINNGFEILPAGSLEEPNPVKDFGYLADVLYETSNEIVKPRKLQKRRSSSSSRSRHTSMDATSQHRIARQGRNLTGP